MTIAIVGAGGHGRVVLDVCREAGLPVAGFVDNTLPVGTKIDGMPILGNDTLLQDRTLLAKHRILQGIGSQQARRRIFEQVSAAGGAFATAIHPSAVVSHGASIADGSVLMAGAIVNTGARIGRCCIINTGASVDHDCVLEDGVQIGPGTVLCGGVECGEDAFVGAGATILPGRKIARRAVVGAGAVVTRDVGAGITVTGIPARAAGAVSEP